MIQLCSEMVIRTFVLENRDHLYNTSAAVVSQMYSMLLLKVWDALLKIGIVLPLCDKDICVFDTSGNFTDYQSAMNSNVDNVDNLHDSVINCTIICHESNMSIDGSTTQLASTPKPSIGITDDEPHNSMDVVPNNLEGDYVVVGYVDNDAQQPKECFQNTEVDLKTSCGRVLLELLGNSDSLKRFDTVRYQLKIKKKSHLALPVSDKALHDTSLKQSKFIVKLLQKYPL